MTIESNDKQLKYANAKASNIKMLILDVDGVMTDGKLYFAEDGVESKAFNILDGHGIKMLQKTGVEVAIVTGRKSEMVATRAGNLGISTLIQGREDKLTAVHEIIEAKNLTLEEVAYIGDDLPDLKAVRQVGLGISVPNGYSLVKQHADLITTANGGEGAVREVCDLIMAAQGNLTKALEPYL